MILEMNYGIDDQKKKILLIVMIMKNKKQNLSLEFSLLLRRKRLQKK
jgi:hypothetical protein